MSLTSAFRIYVTTLPPGSRLNLSRWLSENIERHGFPGQSAFNAEASCRCAQQRLAKKGWLTTPDYARTDKPCPDPWE